MTIEEAIKWQEAFRKTYNGTPAEVDEAIDMAVAALQEYKNHGWIPCSERLPDTGDMYLTTMEKVDNCRLGVCENYFSLSDGWESEEFSEYKVIAWMPLPEPYNGGVML